MAASIGGNSGRNVTVGPWREVDYRQRAIAVEDIEGREVGVDAIVRQPQLDVAQQAFEQVRGLIAPRRHAAE